MVETKGGVDLIVTLAERGVEETVTLAERRSLRRFNLAAPVLYKWKDETNCCDIGCCRDISAAGIFIVTTHCPALHSEIDVEVVLPAFHLLTSETRLRCAGRVVRVEVRDNVSGFGFAVAGPF